MPSWILAIDFGTSYTVAAAKVGDRPPEIVEIAGERRMPSVVMVDPGGEIFVGRTAEDLSITHPGSTLRALKNRLGDQTPAILGGRPHQVVVLVGALLRRVFDEVVVQMGEPPAEVRLTHPATWNQPRVNRLVEAAAKAGLPNPLMVPEPVAAALSYAADVGIEAGRPIAVYDLGGGTFDSAVVVARNGGFTVVGRPGGDQHIGGELFDELIVNHIGQTLDPEVWEAIQVGDDPLWRQVGAALRNEARKAKEALSSHPYVDALVPLPAGLSQIRLTRDEFHEMVRPYIAETVETLRRCVKEAGVRPEELAGISLVGGSSRSPIVEEMVSEAFPMVPVRRRGDPKATVAAGATLADRPSSSAPGLWKSPVTQEASPGTAQQRVRLAPPPLSDPPVGDPPPSSPPPPIPSPPLPPIPTRPASGGSVAPPPPPNPSPPYVLGGQLQPGPSARMSRRRFGVLAAVLLVVVAVVVALLVTRSDDNASRANPSDASDLSNDSELNATDPDVSSDATDPDSTAESNTATGATESTATENSATENSATENSAATGNTAFMTGQPIGTYLETLAGHKAEVTATQFSPDGRWLVTAGGDGIAIVWSIVNGSRVSQLIGHTGAISSAVFSPDGQDVATAGADGTVRLWDAASGKQIAGFVGHTDVVNQVRFSPDGGSLLSASADGTARLWDIASVTEAAVYTGENGRLYFAEFSPDGQLIVGGGEDNDTLLWRLAAPADPLRLVAHTGDVRVGAFSPDGTLVLSGSDDARIRVWSTDTSELVYDLGNIEGGVVSATFSHDGARLMANGHDRTAALWDVATGNLLGDLAGHEDTVYTAVFSADDNYVVTASADATARIWDVSPGTPIGVQVAKLNTDTAAPAAVFSPDGSLVATATVSGAAFIWAGE